MQRSTVNIKKLIADSDFGDVEELSKRWQRSGEASRLTEEPDFKENSDTSNITSQIPTRQKQKQKQLKETKFLKETKEFKETKTRTDLLVETDYKKVLEKEKKTQHGLQYMDEDTEHFKVRLEHLLNVFKTDAVTEFMSMKRSMLDDQKQQVKSDTEKYLRLYEEKHRQLIETRQSLNAKSAECQNLTIRCERMARKIYEQKLRTQTFKCLSGPFMKLVQYKDQKQLKHKKQAMADKFRQKMLIRKAMVQWRENNKICRKQKEEQKLEIQLEEVANKYQKQIQMLREKLTDVNARNDDYERNKNQLQDNLKKAFMRGVCAMNFEAMNALNGQGIPMNDPLLQSDTQSEQSIQHQNTGFMNESHVKTEMSFGGPSTGMNTTLPNNMSSPDFGSKSVVFYKQPKIESKDHNWKDAPVLNIERQSRQRIEDIQPITVIPECISEQEGKVIKVVNGKSSLVGPSQSNKKVVPTKPSTTQKRF